MDKKEYENLKAKFLKLHANVPIPLREEIIAAVDKDTYNWYTANAEIEHDTKKAKLILKQLHKIEVI